MKIPRFDMRSVKPRGYLQMGWMDSVKRELDMRGISVEQGKIIGHDEK